MRCSGKRAETADERTTHPDTGALKTGNTPAWQLWAHLAQFGRHLQPTDWVLVGGQMVALSARCSLLCAAASVIGSLTAVQSWARSSWVPTTVAAVRDVGASLEDECSLQIGDRHQRRVGMPLTVTQDPWLRVDAALRADALGAWQTLAAGSTG